MIMDDKERMIKMIMRGDDKIFTTISSHLTCCIIFCSSTSHITHVESTNDVTNLVESSFKYMVNMGKWKMNLWYIKKFKTFKNKYTLHQEELVIGEQYSDDSFYHIIKAIIHIYILYITELKTWAKEAVLFDISHIRK